MIIDNLTNITKYLIISKKVSDFLLSLTPSIQTGHYIIDDTSYANVDVYETKDLNICKFEAHKKYIDIQMLLEGEERLDLAATEGLKVSDFYSEEKDVMIFYTPERSVDSLYLMPYKFAMIFPHEAHKPQIKAGNVSKKVKKVVVKIKYNP